MPVAIKEAEPLARHTVFRIGGPARFFVTVDSGSDLIAALRGVRSAGLPWFILGAGSNVLVSDAGFDGAIIRSVGGEVVASGSRIVADGSAPMARVVAEALKHGLRGFEWAIGVPGTIGGSVRGNAGCFGAEMKDVVRSVTVFNGATCEVEEWSGDAAKFGYRESIFKRRPELVVLAATIGLQHGDPYEGHRLIREFTARRSASQDIGSPSAGCMFKNVFWGRPGIDGERMTSKFPELLRFRGGHAIPAGFLIDRAGLKGRRIGRAMISGRHGNFFLNTGGASAEEVIMLVGLAKERVRRVYGLVLEEEIQYVGF